ncbi:hypothetical protein OA525_00450 [Alphaproteobacteria bacterium]|nr:hypothetical protein [Alphaproteobacteria bacterium]
MKFFIIIVLVLFSTNSFAHHPGHKVEATAPFPTVNLQIMKDSEDGYNLYIDLKNFNLAPALVGKENQSNTGYLNLYVNDIKVARVYSQWFHIPQRFFYLKENLLKVTLNTNLNGEFTLDGEPIQSILKVKVINN